MHTVMRIIGIVIVFFITTVAWLVLGNTTQGRTEKSRYALDGDVNSLWGSAQSQQAPSFEFEWKTEREETRMEDVEGAPSKRIIEKVVDTHRESVSPDSSQIDAHLGLDQRLRGLLWYSLYDVNFKGSWTYTHAREQSGVIHVGFAFPSKDGFFDDVRIVINGRELSSTLTPNEEGKVWIDRPVVPGQTLFFEAAYKSRGEGSWRYELGKNVANVRNFRLSMHTNFNNIDYPEDSLSPSVRTLAAKGWTLEWKFKNLLTGRSIGMLMPTRIQPGELAAKLAMSAPVSLGFFFVILFVYSVLRKLEIHPVNYLAIAAAFFVFHLLFSYSVDHLHIVTAFIIASAVSIFLVTTYLRLVVSSRFAFAEAAAAQLVYQVGFSVAHFWDHYTGLTVSIMTALTLFILMQLTGRIRWTEVLSKRPISSGPQPTPQSHPEKG